MDWNDLRHFLALARTGSVRAAGASLGVSHSTVLRRVEALEEQLGARLFDRSRGGYALTEAGEDMIASAERVEAEVAAIQRGVAGRDEQLEGGITITCGDAWVADFVIESLRAFCAEHPDIHLHVGVESRLFDLSKREADIAIRALPRGTDPPEHLIGKRVAPMHMGIYISEAHPHLHPDAGGETRWVAFDDANVHRHLASQTPYADLPAWGGMSALTTVVSALVHGYGIGMLPSYVGDAEPALQRIGDGELPHMGDLWILSHPDLRSNARLRACRRALTEAFAERRARFDGSGAG